MNLHAIKIDTLKKICSESPIYIIWINKLKSDSSSLRSYIIIQSRQCTLYSKEKNKDGGYSFLFVKERLFKGN